MGLDHGRDRRLRSGVGTDLGGVEGGDGSGGWRRESHVRGDESMD